MNLKEQRPLSLKEEKDLNRVYEYLVVEFNINGSVTESDILKGIKTSGIKCLPRGMLKVLKEEGLLIELGEGEFRLVTKNKGGEKMKKGHVTSGELKVITSVLQHFEEGFKIKSPSREVFEECLVKAFPKIREGRIATLKMLKNEYLQETDGKITIGEKGKELLSQ